MLSIYFKYTDLNFGGILELIKRNVNLNKHFQRTSKNIKVFELNFKANSWGVSLEEELKIVEYALAADGMFQRSVHNDNRKNSFLNIAVIYDDDITDAFVNTTIKLFKNCPKLQNIFVALEKRFVFTKDSILEGNEGVAPMYEYYLKVSNSFMTTFNLDHQQKFTLHMEAITTQFPQYFEYERCKELVLFKISKIFKQA